MNLLHRIFFITLIVFCNYSCAMEDNNVPTLQQIFDDFWTYHKNIKESGSRDEKIFISCVFAVKNKMYHLRDKKYFKINVTMILEQRIEDVIEDDIKKFKKIFDELFTADFEIKQPNFKCNKELLKEFLSSTLPDLNISSSSSDTEIDKDFKESIDEDSKESIDSIDDTPINSKFASIIQTLRANKLILGGTTFCVVAVLSGCVYALYKNSIEVKKEENKKEDEEESIVKN